MKAKAVKSVSEYISAQPLEIRASLIKIREIILSVVPEAEEGISYGMPGYKYYGPVAYFAVFKNHLGFFPTPTGIVAFKKELSKYKNSKGGVQFPLDKPMPFGLIKKIVKYKVKDNLKKV